MAGSEFPNQPASGASPANETATRNRPRMRRLLRMLLLYVVVPYVAVTLIFALFQRALLYRPTHRDRLQAEAVTGDATVGDVELHAAAGLTLHGWHFQAKERVAPTHPRLVLYFPGNSGCREDRIPDCREFTRLGFDVLLVDYRGYGDNSGSPSEELLAADARRQWLFATRQLDIPAERIILFGESLGGAVAVRLAAEVSLADESPGGLILNSTFASLPETVAWHYPAFLFQFLLLERYPSVERIPHVRCPIVQFHGTSDEFVPVEHGRRLFDVAPASSHDGVAKRFMTVEDGDHNSIPAGRLRDVLMEFAVGQLANGSE